MPETKRVEDIEYIEGGVLVVDKITLNQHGKPVPDCKFKCGPWKQHGVKVWPEVLALLNIPSAALKPNDEFEFPNVRAKILMETIMTDDGRTKRIPKKVLAFEPFEPRDTDGVSATTPAPTPKFAATGTARREKLTLSEARELLDSLFSLNWHDLERFSLAAEVRADIAQRQATSLFIALIDNKITYTRDNSESENDDKSEAIIKPGDPFLDAAKVPEHKDKSDPAKLQRRSAANARWVDNSSKIC